MTDIFRRAIARVLWTGSRDLRKRYWAARRDGYAPIAAWKEANWIQEVALR